jgi:hypothetical protein
MIRIIFITILFLSSNVYAATYLVCAGNDLISAKLGNKTISIKYNTDDYVDYTKKITKWNNEIIEFEVKDSSTRTSFRKLTKEEEFKCQKCINNKGFYSCIDECIKNGELLYIDITRTVSIDRVTGILDWDGNKYQCEVREKTLF